MKDLDFEPVKSRAQFLNNYAKHDLAMTKLVEWLLERGFTVIPYGADRRTEHIWGDDTPDLLAWRREYWLMFIDCKGHLDDTWMVNRRAYNSYLGYSRHYQIPGICAWVNLTTGYIHCARVPFLNPIEDTMPHDKNKVIKAKLTLRIGDLIEQLRITNGQDEHNPLDELIEVT